MQKLTRHWIVSPLRTLVAAVLIVVGAASPAHAESANFTPDQVLAGVQANMTSGNQVNSQPHLNTQTQQANVNVFQVAPGVFAYTSSMAVDTDGSDPDPDPDHLPQSSFQDDNGNSIGAHHVPYYVLGSQCPDGTSRCDFFFFNEHNITGLQFALIFFNGQVIGAVFGDTQGPPGGDPRELGEASVKSAQLLGINSSGINGGVDNGVTVVVFSGPQWVVHGTNETLNANAQAMVQKALNTLGLSLQVLQSSQGTAPLAVPQPPLPGGPAVAPAGPQGAPQPQRPQEPRVPKTTF
jgi:hypothetical protein